MNSVTLSFLQFVISEGSASNAVKFMISAQKFFDKNFPQIKAQAVIHVYSPDCYQLFENAPQSEIYINRLKEIARTGIEKSGPFLKTDKLLLLPLKNHMEFVDYLFVLTPSLEEDQRKLSEVCYEIKNMYHFLNIVAGFCFKSAKEDKANFVSRMAHDLNSLATLISKDVAKDPAIKSQINYSENLSREVLRYLRDVNVEKSRVRVNDLLEGIIAELKLPENVKLNYYSSGEVDFIEVDVELIDRALQSILKNSIFACNLDGGNISVRLKRVSNSSLFINHDWLELEITDTGPGIASDFLSRVKDPFFTTWKEQGHLGLGLANADKIIRFHRGQLLVNSGPNSGTRIKIYLPITHEI